MMTPKSKDAMTSLFTVYNISGTQSTERQLAHRLIINMNEIARVNINDASELCHFSAATISRFCKSIGFDSYAAFRKSLREAIDGVDIVDYVFTNSVRGDESITASYLRQISEMFGEFRNKVDEDAIRDMCGAIHKCKKLTIYATTMNNVYNYLQIDIALDGLVVTSCRDEDELNEAVKHFDRDSYLLVFKHQLKWDKYVDGSILDAKKNGGQVGVVTNSARSQVKKLADHFLYFDGMLHYVDNLLMDTCCMMISAIYRDMFLADKN